MPLFIVFPPPIQPADPVVLSCVLTEAADPADALEHAAVTGTLLPGLAYVVPTDEGTTWEIRLEQTATELDADPRQLLAAKKEGSE